MEKDKLWKGRINKASDSSAEKFTASIGIDRLLYMQDITGTAAHVIGLKDIGIIEEGECKEILAGLKEVIEKIKAGKVDFEEYEDVHSLVEYQLAKISEKSSEKIHTGRSRNDQIVLDELLFLKESTVQIFERLLELEKAIIKKAKENIGLVFPAYTHLQKAQPVLVSHYLLSYYEKFSRHIKKLVDSFDSCDFLPLGAAACAGSGYPINRKLLAGLLKFDRLGSNSMDIVGSRDFIIDFIYCCTMIMLNLGRFCEDLIIYSSQEFSYVSIDDAFCTGSSIMPQKKNPDVLELIRGKSAIAIGNLVQILTLMKGLPSTYNSDMQEDKKILFSVKDDCMQSVEIFTKILESLEFISENISASLDSGFMEATDAADYLVKKGESFRKAHHSIGKIVKYCLDNDLKLAEIPLETLGQYSGYFDKDFYNEIEIKSCISSKTTGCGTSEQSVRDNIQESETSIDSFNKQLADLKNKIPDFNELIKEYI